MVDELSGSKGSRDIANLPYFSESVDLDLILALLAWREAPRVLHFRRAATLVVGGT